MKKINDELTTLWLRFKHSDSDSTLKISMKGGMMIGVAIPMILFSCFLILNSISDFTSPSKYSDIETASNLAFSQLVDVLNNGDQVMLVLYREDCPACQQVEETIVSKVTELENDASVSPKPIVLDLEKLNDDQIESLKLSFPEFLVSGRKIQIPLVANLSATSQRWEVGQYSNTSDSNAIENIFNHWKE